MAAERDSRVADDFSGREHEVLRLIALGHTNAEIAAHLYLSSRTVESHRTHIQQKLRLSGRVELVRYALEHELLDI
jgi:two-component system, NarL family, response regulator NreC